VMNQVGHLVAEFGGPAVNDATPLSNLRRRWRRGWCRASIWRLATWVRVAHASAAAASFLHT
jgi:hypothetical protein